MTVRPANTQISLDIRPVWTESSLCAQWVPKDPSFLHADSEDSYQTGWMPRLIWVFAGRTAILFVLSWNGSNGKEMESSMNGTKHYNRCGDPGEQRLPSKMATNLTSKKSTKRAASWQNPQCGCVWLEPSLSIWRKLGSLATHWTHSEDSDQTGRMPKLIWVFAGRTCHFVGFVMRRLKCYCRTYRVSHNIWYHFPT